MEASPISNQALPSGTRIEEFVIERVLGSGGFGITYLARDVRLDRQVVIKENLPVQFCFRDTHSLTVAPRHTHGEDADNFQWSLENFSKEAAMLASLDHSGIVKVLRSFEAFGTAYFVMPFVEGVTLDELAKERQGKPFSEEELRDLLERVLAALGYLHDRGIYHRDIKPGNLLITKDGIPVLIDFGSARQRLSERSLTVVESAGYTPYEQLQSRGNIGPWSDLYALGATLVKTMTGEAPPKTNDRSFGDPWLPLAGRAELAGRFSEGFLSGIDRSLKLPLAERWQEAGDWLATLRGGPAAEIPSIVTPRTASSLVSAKIPGKKINPLPWIIAAAVAVGLVALANIASNKEPASRAVAVANEAAIQSDRENAQAAEERARVAEQRASELEQEKQALAKQQAELQRATREAAEAEKLAEHAEKQAPNSPRPGEERDFEIAPGVKITMCWIPAGEFVMGSPVGEEERNNDETQHWVRISKGFWLAKTETTQAQWRAVMRNNPSHFKGDDLPVERVSWNDIAGPGGFIEKINQATAATGESRFSLPTEAQWEYACRAGTTGDYAGALDQMAWYSANSGSKTHPIGEKKANDWGLHDMHGNVWEWCEDWYAAYPSSAVTDPIGAASGPYRVNRGGGWDSSALYCRVADRGYDYPGGNGSMGFRLARSSVP